MTVTHMIEPRFSVLMPTLNVMALLPSHIESMRPWLDLVDELIVVDSDSSDGTVDYIRKELGGYPVRIEKHPRGLYQSWNHGISLATRDWLYISTVGDSIEREQLLHLHRVGVSGRSDAVISQPVLIDENGQPLPEQVWAVTELIGSLAKDAPRVLSGGAAFFYALKHLYRSALLGSSASNLYRTAHLQAHPFPANFGVAGDLAWSVLNSFDTRHAVTPRIGSTFRVHQKAYTKADYFVPDYEELLMKTALSIIRSHSGREDANALGIETILDLTHAVDARYSELKALRRQHRPWFLYPQVWRARHESKRARAVLRNAESESFMAIRDRFTEIVPIDAP